MLAVGAGKAGDTAFTGMDQGCAAAGGPVLHVSSDCRAAVRAGVCSCYVCTKWRSAWTAESG